MSTTTTRKPYKQPSYKKAEQLEHDIALYSVKYPWYRAFVEEIHETLSSRDKCESGYRVTFPARHSS